MDADLIFRHFPSLTTSQQSRIAALRDLYETWNARINVISRKDLDAFYLHHVLHSLAIAKSHPFDPGSSVLDIGTGGGFPGIPLAILFPETRFTLVDSIGKKIKVVEDVAKQLSLNNIEAIAGRAENLPVRSWDYVVSRAVTRLSALLPWVQGKFTQGILALKGGDLTEEIAEACQKRHINPAYIAQIPIKNFFNEDFFEEKQIIFIPLQSFKK